jgi:drug/metabolite transporter (DMT)-like permease
MRLLVASHCGSENDDASRKTSEIDDISSTCDSASYIHLLLSYVSFTYDCLAIQHQPKSVYAHGARIGYHIDLDHTSAFFPTMYISSTAVAATASIFTSSPLTRATALQAYETGIAAITRDGDTQLQRWSSFIGIITAIVGNILISFALNIQRYAHIRLHAERQERRERLKRASKGLNGYGTTAINGRGTGHATLREETTEDAEQETDPLTRSFNSSDSQDTICPDDGHHVQDSTYLKSAYWWAGIMLMTIGETGNFLAYGFAPASIVSPLGVVALISNCVIAPFMLKERFRWRDFWGVVVAVGGAVTVVLSAKQKEKKLGPHDVIGAITTTEFEVYMGVTFVLIGILAWASPKYGNRTILVDLGLVGLFGGYTALSTKGVASMLSSTLWKAFTTPITYALVAVLIGTAVMQVRYVNKALQRFDSTQVIPVQFVLFTLSVIIGSAVLYRDFEKTTAERALKFVGGCLLTFFGVFLITSGRDSQSDDEDDEDEESEERIGLMAQDTSTEGEFYQDESFKHRNSQHMRHGLQERVNGVEEADEISLDTSRRSSRVSFAATPTRPSIRLTTTAEASFNSVEDSSPLLNNPWKFSQNDLLATQRHPGMPSTTSSPVLPSEAQTQPSPASVCPTTPRTSSHGDPHTHPNDQYQNGPPQADTLRPVTPAARHSISLMPGPLISPLSSSLTAVVADSLRRGVDSPLRKRSIRRPRLSIRMKSGSEQHGSESATEEESPVKGPGTSQSLGTDRGGELMKRNRARSLSNALDFLRGKRPRKDDGDRDGDPGPSGQTS